ncbi:MAG: hypothetical protein IAE84_09315 [Saprospiraceae bacterium]|nr:hypothetical protein [Saprospiraceae bacterium]
MSAVNKKIKELAGAFEATLTKDFMQKRYLAPVRKFVKEHQAFLEKEGVDAGVMSFCIGAKAFNKTQLGVSLAIPFGSKNIYEAFLASLKDDVRKVWDFLMWENSSDEVRVEKRIGVMVYKMEVSENLRYSSQKKMLLPQYDIFNIGQDYYFSYFDEDKPDTPKFTLGLPLFLRQWLVHYYPQPENAKLTPVAQPAATEYVYDSGERDIATEWPRVTAYKDQEQISYTVKKRPSLTSLPKMHKNLSISEFFPDVDDKRAKTLRTSLLASMAAFVKKNSNSNDFSGDIFKLFRSLYAEKIHSAPMLLPDLKGMGHIDDYDVIKRESELLRIFASLPSGAWVPFENVERFMDYHLLDIQPFTQYTANNKLFYEYEGTSRSWDNKHYITKGLYKEAIILPYLRGSFFLFAAFGLCDIAYDRPNWEQMGRESFSSWDGLRYVRRTALGDFVCGFTKTYDASNLKSDTKITLSPDTLLILTDEKDTSAAGILSPYTERLGGNRFRTDSRLFLSNIKSKKELEAKISLFKQIIGDELPPNWTAFFADMLHKINPFEPIEEAKVLQIPADNKALAKLIAQDPVLKSLVIKAEGFTIIVPKGNYAAMKRRLQEFGYLLTM